MAVGVGVEGIIPRTVKKKTMKNIRLIYKSLAVGI